MKKLRGRQKHIYKNRVKHLSRRVKQRYGFEGDVNFANMISARIRKGYFLFWKRESCTVTKWLGIINNKLTCFVYNKHSNVVVTMYTINPKAVELSKTHWRKLIATAIERTPTENSAAEFVF